MIRHRANGKLLLTAEYLLLDGAVGLAFPTVSGQMMSIQETAKDQLHWRSYTVEGNCWLDCSINPDTLQVNSSAEAALLLEKAIRFAVEKQGADRRKLSNALVQTHLEFPLNWGLGSSSTFVYLLATWLEVNPYELNAYLFKGSGYDIACAGTDSPIFYQLNGEKPTVKPIHWWPAFHQNLFFVYTGRKQNSRDGIARYHERKAQNKLAPFIEKASGSSKNLVLCTDLQSFEEIMIEHESIIRIVTGLETVQRSMFPDYKSGVVKSLGAWGGDFLLVTGTETAVRTYFADQRKLSVYRWDQMILPLKSEI